MGMVMIMEGVIDPQEEMEEMAVMEVMMEMVVEEMIHHHCQIKGNHDAIKIIETVGYMWLKDHPGPQVNQDKMEGMVGNGQIPQLPRGMIDALGMASTPLDITGLENSSENLGSTMVDFPYYTATNQCGPPRSDKKGQ